MEVNAAAVGVSMSFFSAIVTAGYMILKGALDFETINRVRNFRLFHLRGNIR